MNKQEFITKLADSLERQHASGKLGATAPDWGKWFQILEAVIQALMPIITPPVAAKKP